MKTAEVQPMQTLMQESVSWETFLWHTIL